ncbi:hypothetical protein [Olleya sp.]|uniref:type II secretion system protein GspD n=1 Tax=Olleya sp. TaxID=1906788 RepID=UPI0032D8CFA3
MKKILFILLFLTVSFSFAQEYNQRIENIKNQLEILSTETVGLTENVKTEINVSNITLANFLLALSAVHKVNINVDPELNQITIANSFTNVTVADLLVFLCKEYNLIIDFTGNILSIKKFEKAIEKQEERIIPISYNPNSNSISIDVKGDKLYDVFKRIMDETGKNLVFAPGIENRTLTAYIQKTPFASAMNKLAFANDLYVEESKDGFFIFEDNAQSTIALNSNNQNNSQSLNRPKRPRNSNSFFKIKDQETQLLEVDFLNTPIADIIHDIGTKLNINVFTATPLDEAGTATFKAKHISFDDLLTKIFESNSSTAVTTNDGFVNGQIVKPRNPQNYDTNSSNVFTFKKEGNIYFFGTEKQLSVRKVEIIYLQYRSVELLSDPTGGNSSRNNFNYNFRDGDYRNSLFSNNLNNSNSQNNTQQNGGDFNRQSSENNRNLQSQDLLTIVPNEIKEGLDFSTDYELNSFYVTGPGEKIKRFKAFISKIDKPVPVVLIEVMIIEVSRTSTTDTGVEWGIGNEPTNTQGGLYPETDITLGAQTINRIIGGFGDFGGFNLGKVVPNFFAKIKLMESNGDFKILSTPKLATLNGHRATFSNGQTSYYTVTERSIIGTDNPLTNEIVNYVPIEAELGLTIKPSVTGDGHVLLDINVIQSSFGNRVASDAPPDINSRTFTSIIRMQDQDIAILGGLEENAKNNSGSGVPFLARIPIIKYLFSRRTRTAKKSKLSVLIKPTVIQ